jgi:hypothetical protein
MAIVPPSARSETQTLRNAAHSFLFNGTPGGTTTANRRAFDKSLQMLMQMQEKPEQAREQSEPEMEEADTDASDVDSSAEAQPGGTPSERTGTRCKSTSGSGWLTGRF